MTLLVIEEFAGQHADLEFATKPPWCKCRALGEAAVSADAALGRDCCLYCGRYLRDFFNPVVTRDDEEFSHWLRFIRQRPFAEAA